MSFGGWSAAYPVVEVLPVIFVRVFVNVNECRCRDDISMDVCESCRLTNVKIAERSGLRKIHRETSTELRVCVCVCVEHAFASSV